MRVIKSPEHLSEALSRFRKRGKQVGFVPTMGYLHEGHLFLVRRARKENDIVVVSIFVNPTQFGPHEDFKRYPRDLKRDRKLLRRDHVDYLFLPSRSSIYPKYFNDVVDPGPLARYLCGPKRPGHFRGVATVVKRLFRIVHPDRAYFGEKDYQQSRMIEALVQRFRMPIKVRTCPIVREKDGLAMSSRNRYLSRRERISARSLYQSLLQAKKLIRAGERDVSVIKKMARSVLLPYLSKIDYIELVDPDQLTPLRKVQSRVLIAIACYVGSTRLIDNILVKV
ncbi:MAG: pantoate--beta-alanine ligase [Candidatus Omnitrophica bacterium]|nr:pantoate--beta-alanine ligase [Candidatus Omnitrophota bacterium]